MALAIAILKGDLFCLFVLFRLGCTCYFVLHTVQLSIPTRASCLGVTTNDDTLNT